MPLVSAYFDNTSEEYVKRVFVILESILKQNIKDPVSYTHLDYASYIRVQNDVPQTLVSVNHVLFPRALVNLLQNSARAVRTLSLIHI